MTRSRREPASVTVGDGPASTWPESRALDLELLAGDAGLDRRITIPHPQKTGLALAGFDAYLRAGRVLVFGESEVRYLEALDAPARDAALQPRLQPRPAVRPDHQAASTPPPELSSTADRAARAAAAHALRDARAMAQLSALLDNLPVAARRSPRRAARHPRPRRAGRGGERHRQERVRARPGRPRPSAGRRRCRRGAAPGAVVRDRHLSRS